VSVPAGRVTTLRASAVCAWVEGALSRQEHDCVVTRLDDRRSCWTICYASRAFADTGVVIHALAGNAPYLVSKKTGDVFITGTAFPLNAYVRAFEAEGGCDRLELYSEVTQ